jgi:D-alanyl-D-alanine carboxypeptidase
MIKVKKLLVVIFIFFSTIQIVTARTSSPTQSYFNQWAKENEIVGATLAVNNKIYFYGYSDKDLAKSVTEKTQFGIGSITKTFVSVLLLKLEAKGKLNIHHPVAEYLPQYPKLKNVTIQDLMYMTAGFNDVGDDSISPLQQVEMAYKKFNPKLARSWLYSNVSYQLLGILIEKITQQSLNEVISALITSPLNLRSIYIPDKSQTSSFREYQNGKVKISTFKNLYAAGGLVSNVSDLESFIRHLFVIKDLLPSQQYKELTTFVKTSAEYYAFTGTKAPKFGLGVFKWNITPYGDVLMYAGVLGEGFTSAYTVIGNNVIISQSNTYNHNDFTILWPHRAFTKSLIKYLH